MRPGIKKRERSVLQHGYGVRALGVDVYPSMAKWLSIYMGVSINVVTPIAGWFIMEHPIKIWMI